jgi:hypothetical protein
MGRITFRGRKAASEGLRRHLNLWKTAHKPEETPIKDGEAASLKGEDLSKRDPAPPQRNDLQVIQYKVFISVKISP